MPTYSHLNRGSKLAQTGTGKARNARKKPELEITACNENTNPAVLPVHLRVNISNHPEIVSGREADQPLVKTLKLREDQVSRGL